MKLEQKLKNWWGHIGALMWESMSLAGHNAIVGW